MLITTTNVKPYLCSNPMNAKKIDKCYARLAMYGNEERLIEDLYFHIDCLIIPDLESNECYYHITEMYMPRSNQLVSDDDFLQDVCFEEPRLIGDSLDGLQKEVREYIKHYNNQIPKVVNIKEADIDKVCIIPSNENIRVLIDTVGGTRIDLSNDDKNKIEMIEYSEDGNSKSFKITTKYIDKV